MGTLQALAVHWDRLYSASEDGTIREWAAGTWAALRTVPAGAAAAAGQYPRSLAVSGAALVSGSCEAPFAFAAALCEVRVGDLCTLRLERALPQPADRGLARLLAVGGEVWGGVGSAVVVWGRG